MKIKKRYIIICVLLCLASIFISICTYNFELNLSKYSKQNSVVSSTWKNTELFVVKVLKEDNEQDAEDIAKEKVSYLGKVTYVKGGKYTAYGKEMYGNSDVTVIYGDAKIGDKINCYFKPDDTDRLAFIVPYTSYLIGLVVLFVLDVALIIAARFANKALQNNTFSEKPVSIMDIPICILVVGFVICFFMGMFVGSTSVGDDYTNVNEMIAEELEAEGSQYSFGHTSTTEEDIGESDETAESAETEEAETEAQE